MNSSEPGHALPEWPCVVRRPIVMHYGDVR